MKKKLSFFCLASLSLLAIGLDSCNKNQVVPQAAQATSGGEVMTPFGLISAANVHLVEDGSQLLIENGHVFKVRSSTLEKQMDLGGISHTVTPVFRKPVEKTLPDKVEKETPALPGSSNPNWISDSYWYAGDPVTYMATTWVVPSSPTTNHSQLLYIFNGLENSSGSDILQPVLQYGVSPAGGWSGSWSVACWYLWKDAGGTTYAAHTGCTAVTTGTSLTGIITVTGNIGSSYNFNVSFSGYGTGLAVYEGGPNTVGIPYPSIPAQTFAFETFEAYSSTGGVPPASDFPSSTYVAMTGIEIKNSFGEQPPTWTGENQTGEAQTVVVSNASPGGAVHIYFRPPAGPVPVITSLGERPMGGQIGSVIVYFTQPTTEYYPTVTSYNIKVLNTRLGSYLVTNVANSGSPEFAGTPTGTAKGDGLVVSIQAVFFDGLTSFYSSTMGMTY
jgi:hypothetical protein